MRISYLVTTVAACTVGLTAAAALSRRAGRRSPAPTAAQLPSVPPTVAVPDLDGVVLPFVRPLVAAPAPAAPSAPARCGDNGGVTKAGAPCAARGTSGGRCHHHRLAA